MKIFPFSGIWFLHCHVETHLMIGMAMLIKVGDPDEFPKPPSWSRKCGGYDYQPNESLKSSSQEGAPNSENSGVKSEHSRVKSEFSGVYIIVGAGMLIALLLGVIAVLVRKLYNRRTGYTILRT